MRGHGSEVGYQQHRRDHEQACGKCLWAHRMYNKQPGEISRVLKPAPVLIHGTPQALEHHTRSTAPVCEVCLTAACDWERAQASRYLLRLRRSA